MTDCPPRLRGDLSKWLCEINTGVYVGNVSGPRAGRHLGARLPEPEKWPRNNGVFNERRTENGLPRAQRRGRRVDFDGIQLMRRPLPQSAQTESPLKPGFSNAAKRQMAQRKARRRYASGIYVIIDLETTGLQNGADQILEFGAIRYKRRMPRLFFPARPHRKSAAAGHRGSHGDLAGNAGKRGRPSIRGPPAFLDFIGTEQPDRLQLTFDMAFSPHGLQGPGKPLPQNRCLDLLSLARRKIFGVPN